MIFFKLIGIKILSKVGLIIDYMRYWA